MRGLIAQAGLSLSLLLARPQAIVRLVDVNN